MKAFESRWYVGFYVYGNHSGVFGDRLLLQVVVLVDTTDFWSYEDTRCAEFCSTELFCYYRNLWCFSFSFFFLWRCDPTRVMASSFLRLLDQTQRRTTVGRAFLDEWSSRRRDLYLTTHNTHNRQISMPPGGIQTHDLSRRAAADLLLRPRDHWDRL